MKGSSEGTAGKAPDAPDRTTPDGTPQHEVTQVEAVQGEPVRSLRFLTRVWYITRVCRAFIALGQNQVVRWHALILERGTRSVPATHE